MCDISQAARGSSAVTKSLKAFKEHTDVALGDVVGM